jgi:hypothetical protein
LAASCPPLGAAGKILAGSDAFPPTATYHCQQTAEKQLFLARLLMVLRDYQGVLDDLIRTVGAPDEWIPSDHAATLAD